MKTIFVLLAIVGCALAQASSSEPIPTCDWTFTTIERPNHTETIAIPMATPACSYSSFTVTATASGSITPPAPPPPPVVAPTAGTGTGYPPISSYTGPVINAAAMPTAAPILLGGALGIFAMI